MDALFILAEAPRSAVFASNQKQIGRFGRVCNEGRFPAVGRGLRVAPAWPSAARIQILKRPTVVGLGAALPPVYCLWVISMDYTYRGKNNAGKGLRWAGKSSG